MGHFFAKLHELNRQACLIPALIPSLKIITTAPYEKQFYKIKLEEVIRLVIAITEPTPPKTTTEWHIQIAMELLKVFRQENDFTQVLVNAVTTQLKDLKPLIDDATKEQMRQPLESLLKTLTGLKKRTVQQFSAQFGYKRASGKSPRTSRTIATNNHLRSPVAVGGDSRRSSLIVAQSGLNSTREGSMSQNIAIINDENANETVKNNGPVQVRVLCFKDMISFIQRYQEM